MEFSRSCQEMKNMTNKELKEHLLTRCLVPYAREADLIEEYFKEVGFNASSLSRYVFLKDLAKLKCRVWESDVEATENWKPIFYPLKVGPEIANDDWIYHDHLIIHPPLVLKSTGEYCTHVNKSNFAYFFM